MPKALTEASIQELSIVLKDGPGGVEYAPRNPNARVLVVKGAAKPNFLERVLSVFKGGEWPVSSDVADDVDNDGDGADDYNELVSLLARTYSDLQSCMGIMDDDTRSAAMKVAIDGFKAQIDAIYAGEDDDADKAGARHSAADKATIDKLGEHLQEAKNAVAAASDAHAALMPADTSGEEDDDTTKAAATGAILTPEGVAVLAETIAATKASLEQHSAEPAATETAKAGEIDMTQEQIDALIASTAQKAAEAAVTATTAALQPQIDAANAAAETAKAAATEATQKADLLATEARKPSAASVSELEKSPTAKALPNGATFDPQSRLQKTIKAHMGTPAGRESSVI